MNDIRKTGNFQKLLGFILAILYFLPASSFAQTACFTVDIEQGCYPLTVDIVDCSGSTDISYIITSNDFPDVNIQYSGNQLTNGGVQHTFDDPSDWTIQQFVGTGGGADQTSFVVTVEPPTIPDLSLLACNGNGLRVSIANDFVYGFYEIDFGDGTVQRYEKPFPTDPLPIIEHIYANNQPVTVLVKGGFKQNDGTYLIGNCEQASAEFTPIAQIEAAQITRLETQLDGNLVFSYDLPQAINYRLEESINGGAFAEVATLDNGSSETTLNNRNIPDDNYCYRIAATDACTGTSYYSNVICNTYLDAQAQNNQNVLSWPVYPDNAGFIDYSLTKRNDDIAEPFPPFTDRNLSGYTDTEVVCKGEYCYQLEVELTDGAVSVSPNTCVIAISDDPPPQAEAVTASVEGEKMIVSWGQPQGIPPAGVTLVKLLPNGTSEQFIGATQPFMDTAVNVASESYCYEVNFEDACGNTSASATTCSMVLTGEKEETGNLLTWSPFSAENESFSYFLEVLDGEGNVVRTVEVTNANQLSYSDVLADQEGLVMRYRIRASSNNGLQAFSNTVTIMRDTSVKVPDAFTPNSDGLNDTFRAYGNFLNDYTLEVFNRWGNMLYQSNEIENGWDGSFKGEEVPAGPYTYVIRAMDEAGNEIKQKGIFLLVR